MFGFGQLIEILKKNNGVYIKNYTLTPRAGLQAAELNADEQSSLYQSIKTTPGSFVKWGISHHGRNGYDTMLLVIGPKQSVNPAKKAKGWAKAIKKLVDNPELITLIKNNLHDTVKDRYDIRNVTKRRAEWYKEIVAKKKAE